MSCHLEKGVQEDRARSKSPCIEDSGRYRSRSLVDFYLDRPLSICLPFRNAEQLRSQLAGIASINELGTDFGPANLVFVTIEGSDLDDRTVAKFPVSVVGNERSRLSVVGQFSGGRTVPNRASRRRARRGRGVSQSLVRCVPRCLPPHDEVFGGGAQGARTPEDLRPIQRRIRRSQELVAECHEQSIRFYGSARLGHRQEAAEEVHRVADFGAGVCPFPVIALGSVESDNAPARSRKAVPRVSSGRLRLGYRLRCEGGRGLRRP